MAAPKKNKNAQKGSEKANSFINIRVTKKFKNKIIALAKKDGISLSAYIIKKLS